MAVALGRPIIQRPIIQRPYYASNRFMPAGNQTKRKNQTSQILDLQQKFTTSEYEKKSLSAELQKEKKLKNEI